MEIIGLSDISYNMETHCSTVKVRTDGAMEIVTTQHDAWDENTSSQLPAILAAHPQLTGAPRTPNAALVWNCDARQWVDIRNLQACKDIQWAKIKQARAAAEFGGFHWDGSAFDSNPVAMQRISGAVQLAALAADFSVDWTLQDNTVRTLSATDMVGVGMALGAHSAVCHNKARALRAQIDAAQTSAEVLAIAWT